MEEMAVRLRMCAMIQMGYGKADARKDAEEKGKTKRI